MQTINIVYLPYRRWHFSELLFMMLSKCQFKDFHITICGMGHHRPDCENICGIAKEKYGLNASVFTVNTGYTNYIDKIKWCVEQNYKYSIKLDEDIFINTKCWDYIFNNINILDNDDNLLLSPALSSGIPTVDLFMEYSLNQQQRNHMIELFSNTVMGSAFGVNYSSLNSALKGGYDANKFYTAVQHFNHHYRGIHPIRINSKAALKMNEYILQNVAQFLEPRDYFIQELDRPYLCNSCFAIRTDVWKNIVNDGSLFSDNFDEVPLNRYKFNNRKKMLFIANAFGIHTLYNTLFEFIGEEATNQNEEKFFQSLLNYCKENS